MKQKIQSYAGIVFPSAQNVTVSEPMRISEGWQTEIYSFDVEYELRGNRRREALILRIFPGQGAEQQAAKEFRAMKRLRRAGYPVPQVMHCSDNKSSVR